MKEFLDTLYKVCSQGKEGMHELFDVIPALAGQRKFQTINQLMVDIDLTRIDTGTMYGLIHLTSDYINQLSHYRETYQKIREEFARRGETSAKISRLFDRYKDGSDRLFDPNAPPYKSPDEKFEDKLAAKITWAKEIGDKDLEDMLTFYQAERLHREERDRKFRQARIAMGDEEMRKRTIESLREVADLLEKSAGCWPGIYYCKLPEDPLLKRTFIDGIEVIISYPWPG